MRSKTKRFDNDAWIRRNFTRIVRKFGGKYPYIFVASGRVFPIKSAKNITNIEEGIRRKYGPPIGMPVPKPEDFNAILSQIKAMK